ncbi:MAG TPA: hypothetical protein VKH42_11380, partial [Vicinamibacterales bacterium]|nr:hypothetical protein [Vicinamibacterales bacterium]
MASVVQTKRKTVRINGCVASAQAAKYADVDVIAAYPIRPYTATMMALAQMVANGELDAEYIVADSEHSQLSIAHGAASSGARVFTGSSGVGVHYAYELYSPISGSRMPVQMMIADRTLDPRRPVSHGPQIMPEQGPPLQLERARAMEGAVPVIEQAHDEFARIFGRRYDPWIEEFMTDGAEVVFFLQGAHGVTAR